MITMTKKEAWSFIFWTLFAGAVLGYTLGLIQQASWQNKTIEEQEYYAE